MPAKVLVSFVRREMEEAATMMLLEGFRSRFLRLGLPFVIGRCKINAKVVAHHLVEQPALRGQALSIGAEGMNLDHSPLGDLVQEHVMAVSREMRLVLPALVAEADAGDVKKLRNLPAEKTPVAVV